MKFTLSVCFVLLLIMPGCQQKAVPRASPSQVLMIGEYRIPAGGYHRVAAHWSGLPANFRYEVEVLDGKSEVELYVFDLDNYEKFLKGESAQTIYNSGRFVIKKFGTFINAGDYYIVIHNRHSNVDVNINAEVLAVSQEDSSHLRD